MDGDVEVVCSRLSNLWARDFVENIHHLNHALLRDAVALHLKAPFDLIHAHDWSVAFAASGLKHAFRLPLVATIHATERGRNLGIGTDEQRYISQGDWFLAYEAWKVICCSRAMREEIIRDLSVPEDKIHVIHNATQVENFAGRFNRKLFRRRFVQDDEKLVLFVGRLVFEKGVQVLLGAAARLNDKAPRTKFVIVGSGDQAWLAQIALERGVADRVEFIQRLPDKALWRLYRVADVAVFPSLYEPFGMVAVESMAAGTLTVVSDVGGLSEIVEHGVDGMKFPPGDETALAQSLEAALFDSAGAAAIGRRAQEKVRRLYTWPPVADETLDVYQSVLQERKKSRWHDNLHDEASFRHPASGRANTRQKERRRSDL
jgi:glycosyltransferase involved in cell wall biosynthesis